MNTPLSRAFIAVFVVGTFHTTVHAMAITPPTPAPTPTGFYVDVTATGAVAHFDPQTGSMDFQMDNTSTWGYGPEGKVVLTTPINLQTAHVFTLTAYNTLGRGGAVSYTYAPKAVPAGTMSYEFVHLEDSGPAIRGSLYVDPDFNRNLDTSVSATVLSGAIETGHVQINDGTQFYIVGSFFIDSVGNRACTQPLIVKAVNGKFPTAATVSLSFSPDASNYTGYSCSVVLR